MSPRSAVKNELNNPKSRACVSTYKLTCCSPRARKARGNKSVLIVAWSRMGMQRRQAATALCCLCLPAQVPRHGSSDLCQHRCANLYKDSCAYVLVKSRSVPVKDHDGRLAQARTHVMCLPAYGHTGKDWKQNSTAWCSRCCLSVHTPKPVRTLQLSQVFER